MVILTDVQGVVREGGSGFKAVVDVIREAGFKGRGPYTRRRSDGFVDWLAVSGATRAGLPGEIAVHVNVGVTWEPLARAWKVATALDPVTAHVMDPLYTLLTPRDASRWTLAPNDENLAWLLAEFREALAGAAEQYWRENATSETVLSELERVHKLQRFPDALFYPLAVGLRSGCDQALQVVGEQREILAHRTGPAPAQHSELLEHIKEYLVADYE